MAFAPCPGCRTADFCASDGCQRPGASPAAPPGGRRPSLLALVRRVTARRQTDPAEDIAPLLEEIRRVMNEAPAQAQPVAPPPPPLPVAPAPTPAPGLSPLTSSAVYVAVAFGVFVIKIGPVVQLAPNKDELRRVMGLWVDSL